MPFHICPDEIFAFMMALPIIGGAFHWLRHKLWGTKCPEDSSCTPKCDHHVIEDDGAYDPLDP
jgi:hypothetical protein